jgi:hypothetical protein
MRILGAAFALQAALLASCNQRTDNSTRLTLPKATNAAGSASGVPSNPPTAVECAPSSAAWLPDTPPVPLDKPPPHPAPDCPFYQDAWQTFLIVTKPAPDGAAAFLAYPSVEDVFGGGAGKKFAKKIAGKLSLAVRDIQGQNVSQPSPPTPFIGGGFQQAGARQILIDQNGHPVYYGIHVNHAFVDFIRAHGLTTADAIRNADENLTFPAGVVELKSAWRIVDGTAPSDYITARARVPALRVVNGILIEDRNNPREVTVELLALHVVFTLKGHPEFIWSTFEHVGTDGTGDVAPPAPVNPDQMKETQLISSNNYPLYKANTPASGANLGIEAPPFDVATQTFKTNTTVIQTSIYRLFPASKTNTTEIDDDIAAINKNIGTLFSNSHLAVADRRSHYRLVGAVWIDQTNSFGLNKRIANNDSDPDIIAHGTDSKNSILGGEDALSSVAIESFTQSDSPNCFSCHDTRAVKRDRTAIVILKAKQLNVSHLLSRFVDESQSQ